MKLYYQPGACSLSPHIVLREAGFEFDLEKANVYSSRRTDSGRDFDAVVAKGYVPAIELDNGELLTEGVVIVQYLADQKPEAGLAPPNGSFARVRLQEWLNYLSTEVHKSFYPLFHPECGKDAAKVYRRKLSQAFSYLAEELSDRNWLTGDRFSVADAYLFTLLSWTRTVGIDLAEWPILAAYQQRAGERPAVKAALVAEGLLPAAAA